MIPIRDDAPRFSTPYVTYFLLALNTVVFLFELTFPVPQRDQLMFTFGEVPIKITALLTGVHNVSLPTVGVVPVTAQTALIPVLTSMFMHAGWLHLIFNMWALWIFGDNVEDYLGHFWYLVFYLVAGLAAAALHTVLNTMSVIPSVGASGAIAGVMGAYLILFPSARVTTLVPFFFLFFIRLPAWLVLGYWFVLQFLSGTATAIAYSNQTTGGIAFWAHVGGFVAGVALIRLFPKRPRRYHFSGW